MMTQSYQLRKQNRLVRAPQPASQFFNLLRARSGLSRNGTQVTYIRRNSKTFPIWQSEQLIVIQDTV